MLAYVFVGVAGLIHVYVFIMESLLWGRPKTNKTFGMSSEQAEANRLFAFNQGFYNLFLAIAALGGIALSSKTLMTYSSASMVGAGAALLYSRPQMLKAAFIQAGPPLLGLLFLFLV